MTAPPDLGDPVARVAYARELRSVARPVRWLGLGLALIALLLAVLRARYVPALPAAVPVFLIVVAALHLVAGVMIRTRYRHARMRGEPAGKS